MTGAAPVDFDALLAMLGGDRQVTVALLTTFTEELSADIADCEQALTQQDTEALRQIAHRIKGTSANLQATMLSAAARELEQACSETTEGVRVIKHRVMLDQAQSVRDAIEAWSMAVDSQTAYSPTSLRNPPDGWIAPPR